MQPYDFTVLAAALKAKGLDLTEEAVRDLFLGILAWLEDSAKASATVIDDIALSLIEQYKGLVLQKIDTINGKVG